MSELAERLAVRRAELARAETIDRCMRGNDKERALLAAGIDPITAEHLVRMGMLRGHRSHAKRLRKEVAFLERATGEALAKHYEVTK